MSATKRYMRMLDAHADACLGAVGEHVAAVNGFRRPSMPNCSCCVTRSRYCIAARHNPSLKLTIGRPELLCSATTQGHAERLA